MARRVLLSKLVCQSQLLALVAENEIAGFLLIFCQACDGARLAKKKPQMLRLFQRIPESRVGVNREIGGDKGKLTARLHFLPEEVGDTPARMIVEDS